MNLNWRAKRLLSVCVAGLLSGPLIGCSGLKPGTDTAQGNWSCLANGVAPKIPAKIPGTIHYIVPIVDFDNTPSELQPNQPVMAALIPDLDIKVCPGNDGSCAVPIAATVTPNAIPGVPYVYQVDIPGGLDPVYLRITQLKMPANGHIPTDYFFAGSLVSAQDGKVDAKGDATIVGEAIPIPTLAKTAALLQDFHLSLDPTKGVLAARTIDCNGKRAAGVVLELDPTSAKGAVGYTLTNQGTTLPSDPASPTPTDSRGVAGFGNMTPGGAKLTAKLEDGTEYGYSAPRISAAVFSITEVRPVTLFAK